MDWVSRYSRRNWIYWFIWIHWFIRPNGKSGYPRYIRVHGFSGHSGCNWVCGKQRGQGRLRSHWFCFNNNRFHWLRLYCHRIYWLTLCNYRLHGESGDTRHYGQHGKHWCSRIHWFSGHTGRHRANWKSGDTGCCWNHRIHWF